MVSAVTAVRAEEPNKKSTKKYDDMVYVEGRLPAYQLDKDESITLMMVKKDADLSTPKALPKEWDISMRYIPTSTADISLCLNSTVTLRIIHL